MPWHELAPMDQRLLFIRDHARGAWPMAVLCAQYGVSEKTGYKWLARFAEGGAAALADRSHAPHACRQRWGPRKLVAYLQDHAPNEPWPAPSSVGALLARQGLSRPRRRRPPLGHPGKPATVVKHANQLWTADFKGQFRTRDGVYRYPLTVYAAHTRFLLGCRALDSVREAGARPVFRRLFREYGLPEAIRTDNGVPFASITLAQFLALSVARLCGSASYPTRRSPTHPRTGGMSGCTARSRWSAGSRAAAWPGYGCRRCPSPAPRRGHTRAMRSRPSTVRRQLVRRRRRRHHVHGDSRCEGRAEPRLGEQRSDAHPTAALSD